MACGRRALGIARMQKGERLLVLGAGSMALSMIYWARLLGAGRIAVASRSAKRDEIVRAFGADATVRLDDDDPGAVERALGGPPDIVAEVESEKASFEVEAFSAGTVTHIAYRLGDLATVLQPLLFVGEAGEKMEAASGDAQTATAATVSPLATPAKQVNLGSADRHRSSPLARRLASYSTGRVMI